MRTLLIETEATPERLEQAVLMMREVKAYYEAVAEKRVAAGAMTEEGAAAKLEPLADALILVCLAEEAARCLPPPRVQSPLMAPVKALAGAMDVTAENVAECGEHREPRCRFCGGLGKRAGEERDYYGKITDRLYVCVTPGCRAAAIGTPVSGKVF